MLKSLETDTLAHDIARQLNLDLEAGRNVYQWILHGIQEPLRAGQGVVLPALMTLTYEGVTPQPFESMVLSLARQLHWPPGHARVALDRFQVFLRNQILLHQSIFVSGLGSFTTRVHTPLSGMDSASGRSWLTTGLRGIAWIPAPEIRPSDSRLRPCTFISDPIQRDIRSVRAYRVLLVLADDGQLKDALCHHYQQEGWRTTVASSAIEALSRIRKPFPHLVLVQDAVGRLEELLHYLKRQSNCPDVPVVVLYDQSTARDTGGIRLEGDAEAQIPFQIMGDEDAANCFNIAQTGLSSTTARIRFSCGSTEDDVEQAVVLVQEILSQRIGEDARERVEEIGSCFREALCNAARHGNGSDPNRRVTASLVFSDLELRMSVEDEGLGFDYIHTMAKLHEQSALHAARERAMEGGVGGLGLLMLQRKMDRVEFERDGARMVFSCLLPRAHDSKTSMMEAAGTEPISQDEKTTSDN